MRIKALLYIFISAFILLFSHSPTLAQTCGSQLVVDHYNCIDTNPDAYAADCVLTHSGQGTYSCSMQGNQCQTNSTVCDSSNNSSVCYKISNGTACATDFTKCGKDLCWVSGGPTTAPGQPTPTPAGGTTYWRASGETRNATNGLLGGVTLTFAWPSGSPQTVNSGSTQFLNLGVYTMTKNAASVPGSGNFQVTAAKAGHNAFEATNANPGYGCTRINGNSAYSCPMSMGFNKPDPPPSVLHFKEKTATVNVVPNATIKDVVNLEYDDLLPWTVEATDANGNLQSSGIYIHQGTPAIGVTTGWTPLKWVGGQNTSAMTFRHSDTNGVTPWQCTALRQGTWTVTTNAVDTAGLKCSGNPIGAVPRCALVVS